MANDSTCCTRTLFPGIPVLIPAITLAFLRLFRRRGAAKARGDIGCSTRANRRPASGPSSMKRTPIEPIKPAAIQRPDYPRLHAPLLELRCKFTPVAQRYAKL
jgi:hypothetical protein